MLLAGSAPLPHLESVLDPGKLWVNVSGSHNRNSRACRPCCLCRLRILSLLHLKLSLQLSCLRMPLKSALQTAAELGYQGVEIDARQELSAPVSRTAIRQLLKYLDDYRLRVACLTFQTRRSLNDSDQLEQRLDALKNTLRLAYQLRCNCVVSDIGEIPTAEATVARDQLRDVIDDLGRWSQKEGAFLAARTGIAAPEELAQLIAESQPASLMVDLDPANLLLHGHAIAPALEHLRSHVIHLHARDAVRDFSARRAVEVELGRGSVDWPTVFAALEQANYNGFATVGRSDAENPRLECQQAGEYLQNLFA